MRLVWTTDIHLNFVDGEHIARWAASVRGHEPDAVLLSGDIAEASDLLEHLEGIDEALQLPVYFVLGNHDYYRGSIAATRQRVAEFSERRPNLIFLTRRRAPVLLDDATALIGHDGWADGRAGDYFGSWVMMNDYRLIAELSVGDKRQRGELLKALGDEAAGAVQRGLEHALQAHRRVILLTHVPPFREACWYEGRLSDDEWAPHFVCVAMGQAILKVMRAHPEANLLVLCGHTHGQGETRPLHNVTVLTGGAVYGEPAINMVFEI